MRDNTALVVFVLALAAILCVLVWRSDPVGEPAPPLMTTEDAEVTPYVP